MSPATSRDEVNALVSIGVKHRATYATATVIDSKFKTSSLLNSQPDAIPNNSEWRFDVDRRESSAG